MVENDLHGSASASAAGWEAGCERARGLDVHYAGGGRRGSQHLGPAHDHTQPPSPLPMPMRCHADHSRPSDWNHEHGWHRTRQTDNGTSPALPRLRGAVTASPLVSAAEALPREERYSRYAEATESSTPMAIG